MKPVLIALALALPLAGCELFPSKADLQTADYGPPPTDYEAIVRRSMDVYLKDGESARYKFLNTPSKFAHGPFELKAGWIVCVDVNGKNGYGAYDGYRRHYFLINNDRIIEEEHADGTWRGDFVDAMCRNVVPA